MIEKITRPITNRPEVFLIIIGLLVILSGFKAAELRIDPGFDKLISPDGEYNQNAKKIEHAFGQNNALDIIYSIDKKNYVSVHPNTLEETRILEDYQDLKKILLSSQYVTSVSDLIISEDKQSARVSVGVYEPNTAGSLQAVKQEVEELVSYAPKPAGVNIQVSGFAVLLDRVSTLLITDNLKTIIITVIIVFITLATYFRSLKMGFVGIIIPVCSAIVLAAIMSLLNINITLTLAAVGVIMIGIGADYSIHIISAYNRNLKKNNPKNAIKHTLKELEIPIIASYLTTVAGFAALALGVSPASKSQGVVLTLGITITFLLTTLTLPAILVLLKKPVREINISAKKIIRKLAYFQTHHPKSIILVVVGITIIMFFGISKVYFSTSNSNWIPDDDPVSKSFRELDYTFGNTDKLQIIIESTKGDLRDPQTAKDIIELEQRLKSIPGIKIINPYKGAELTKEGIYKHTQQDNIKRLFSSNYQLTTLTIEDDEFLVDKEGNSIIIPAVREVIERNSVYNAKMSLFGDVVRFDELGKSLQQDTAVTTMIGLVLVLLIASIVYLSIVSGIIALAPIIIAVIWSVGLMGFLGVPFTSLSTGIIALVLGIGVDFSLHLLSSINHYRKKGLQKAITKALETTGGAIMLSSLTTFTGFMALSFATLLGTRRLGWSLAIAIVSVLAVTIILVPSIIALSKSKYLKNNSDSS